MGVAVVADGVVHGGPVVPEPQVAFLPAVADDVLGCGHVVVEEAEEGLALLGGQPLDALGEAGIDEEVPAPRLGVGSDDGVLGRRQLGEGHAVPLAATNGLEQRSEGASAVVNGGQSIDQLLDGSRQPFVGGLGVGPQGVTPRLGDHDGVEDRTKGRGLDEGDVGVPALAVAVLAPHAVGELARLRVVDLEDLLVLLDPRDDRVRDRDRAERCGEFLVLARGQMLAGEEDDLVVEQRLADGRQRVGVERLVQVDAADLGSDGA